MCVEKIKLTASQYYSLKNKAIFANNGTDLHETYLKGYVAGLKYSGPDNDYTIPGIEKTIHEKNCEMVLSDNDHEYLKGMGYRDGLMGKQFCPERLVKE